MTARFRYIPALDGIRALAVAGVIADHGGINFLQGGFLGVDAFFVLSGFLITSLLVSEWHGTGGIDLKAFWGRRARRLLAALCLLVLAVSVYARYVATPGTYPDLRIDVLATLFYVANWHFILAGESYFNQSGPTSLLQHTWSLAIEEQFYIVWPIVVLGLFKLRRSIWPLLTVSILGVLASAAEMAALFHPGMDTTRLYFGTDTQAQSLLVGASLACGLALWSRRRGAAAGIPIPTREGTLTTVAEPARVTALAAAAGPSRWEATTTKGRTVLTLGGFVGLAICVFTWSQLNGNDTSTFGGLLFRGGFLLTSSAVALVLLAVVCVSDGPIAAVLSLRPLRYLGRISYGLYLWHFPIFLILDRNNLGLGGLPLFAARVAAALAVSVASFHLVEQPIRRNTWNWSRLRTGLCATGAATLAVILATVPLAGGAALAAGPPSMKPTDPSQTAKTSATKAPTVRMLLVGDSLAETLGNGLAVVAANYGIDLLNEGDPNCALATGSFLVKDAHGARPAPPCNPASNDPGWPTDWGTMVDHFQPQVSVFLARLDIMDRVIDGQVVSIGNPGYDTYLLHQMNVAVQVLSSRHGKVVFLTSPYYDSGEQPDGAPWPEDDPARVDLYNKMLDQVAAQYPGTAYVIDLNKIADPDGRYQAVIDDVPVRFTDGVHWTYFGDWWLAPRILPQIYRIGAGSPAA